MRRRDHLVHERAPFASLYADDWPQIMSSQFRRPLPPLNALRAFEAAARHLSLSLARTN